MIDSKIKRGTELTFPSNPVCQERWEYVKRACSLIDADPDKAIAALRRMDVKPGGTIAMFAGEETIYYWANSMPLMEKFKKMRRALKRIKEIAMNSRSGVGCDTIHGIAHKVLEEDDSQIHD